MARFLLETYVSRSDTAAVDAETTRARRAADRLTRTGTAVSHVSAVFVPEEETCFHLYEADSIDDVRRAARLAGLPVGHVVEAMTTPKGDL